MSYGIILIIFHTKVFIIAYRSKLKNIAFVKKDPNKCRKCVSFKSI